MTCLARGATRAAPFLLLGVILFAACGGGGAKSTPTNTTLEPVLVDVLPGTVIDLERAAQLHRERDFEGALVIYSAAARNGTPEQRQAGLLATARIQNETGEHDSAARTALALHSETPPPEQDRQALLIAGSALFAEGETEAARGPLEEYVALGGPASVYAQVYLAQVDAGENDLDAAAAGLTQALQSGLPPEPAYQAQLLLAGVEVQRDNAEEAASAYRAAAEVAPTARKAAEALWLLAENSDDDEVAGEALRDLVVGYPSTDRTLEALDSDLLEDGDLITPIQRATVLFNNRQNEEATEALDTIVADPGTDPADLARAEYDLGILSERAEEWESAIGHYQATIDSIAAGIDDLRAQASWDQATVFEYLGRTNEAIQAYAAVADHSATADRAAEGLFRAGYMALRDGQPGDSAAYWTRYLDVAPANELPRAYYWLAEAAYAEGNVDTGSSHLAQAASEGPLDYYGMRAAARLAGEVALPDALEVDPSAPDWNAYETWLAGWAGPEDAAGTSAMSTLFASEEWLGAVDLLEAGLTDQADSQFRSLLVDNAADAWLTYRLILAISEFHRPWLTSPAAAGLLGAPDAPPEALQLVYPLEFWELVQKEAAERGFSPLLLLALIRQESLYDPGAVSPANALGLTQVVPTTAEAIAEELGVDDFEEGDLLTAKTGLQFGAFYLGQTLDGFGGALPPTFAGYNAGPGTSGAWWEDAGTDTDLFLESIPYAETRIFVEVVLENYARYLYAYGVTDSPSLPLS